MPKGQHCKHNFDLAVGGMGRRGDTFGAPAWRVPPRLPFTLARGLRHNPEAEKTGEGASPLLSVQVPRDRRADVEVVEANLEAGPLR